MQKEGAIMTQETLAVKLYELDDQIGKLHSRIHLCESTDSRKLRQTISFLEQECALSESAMEQKLKLSRADCVSALAKAYQQVEQIIRQVKTCLTAPHQAADDTAGDPVENRILMAEYTLDFALQAANHALLDSLKAIESQKTREEAEEKRSFT